MTLPVENYHMHFHRGKRGLRTFVRHKKRLCSVLNAAFMTFLGHLKQRDCSVSELLKERTFVWFLFDMDKLFYTTIIFFLSIQPKCACFMITFTCQMIHIKKTQNIFYAWYDIKFLFYIKL